MALQLLILPTQQAVIRRNTVYTAYVHVYIGHSMPNQLGVEGPLTWKGDGIYYFWQQILADWVSFTQCNNMQQNIFTQFWDIGLWKCTIKTKINNATWREKNGAWLYILWGTISRKRHVVVGSKIFEIEVYWKNKKTKQKKWKQKLAKFDFFIQFKRFGMEWPHTYVCTLHMCVCTFCMHDTYPSTDTVTHKSISITSLLSLLKKKNPVTSQTPFCYWIWALCESTGYRGQHKSGDLHLYFTSNFVYLFSSA